MPRRTGGDLNAWWRAGLAVVAPLVAAAFDVEVRGAANVPDGLAILAGNHLSALDGPLLAIATAREVGRMTRFLVAAEFFEKRRFGWALRLYRQIPLRRRAGDDEALREAIRTVAEGALAGIFPEGRVSAQPSVTLQRGHTGVARIALATRAPVVPVGIWGTQDRWPLPGLHLRPPLRTRVAIVYGPPVPPIGDAGSPEDVQSFTSEVMRAIQAVVAVAIETAERPRRRPGRGTTGSRRCSAR
jgi:1-acyl-sn-glycerol-3-phosphate acyltransferase